MYSTLYTIRSPTLSFHSLSMGERWKHQDQTGPKYNSKGITTGHTRSKSCSARWDSSPSVPKCNKSWKWRRTEGDDLGFSTRTGRVIMIFLNEGLGEVWSSVTGRQMPGSPERALAREWGRLGWRPRSPRPGRVAPHLWASVSPCPSRDLDESERVQDSKALPTLLAWWAVRLRLSESSRYGPSPRPWPSRCLQDRPWAGRDTYSPEGRQAHQSPQGRLLHCRHLHPASPAAAQRSPTWPPTARWAGPRLWGGAAGAPWWRPTLAPCPVCLRFYFFWAVLP